MINRILIRIKVVQMLYSYLLTQTDFRIDAQPQGLSNDNKFAHAVYLDLLLLMLEISGTSAIHGQPCAVSVTDPKLSKKLTEGKLAKALAGDPLVQRIMLDGKTDIASLRGVAQHLHDTIVGSEVYNTYKRKKGPRKLADEVQMWTVVVETILAKDPVLDQALRQLDGYSNVGFRRAINQLSSTLNSYFASSESYIKACDDLQTSLDKAYQLYVSLFVLILELTREQERRIETAKAKHLATAADLNPNMRFVNNALAQRLAQCPSLESYLNDNKDEAVGWETDVVLINKLLADITASQLYADYMASPAGDYEADCEFWREVMRSIIFPSDALAEALEDKSVYWNDDLPIMGTFVLKTLRQAATNPGDDVCLLPKYKDDEDARFGAELFQDAVRNHEEYRASLIDTFIDVEQWDPERLAFMDIVILTTAISELINYPNIPVAVTINEYIEIANSYSSPKSGQFVNGILFNVVNKLRQDGVITK